MWKFTQVIDDQYSIFFDSDNLDKDEFESKSKSDNENMKLI